MTNTDPPPALSTPQGFRWPAGQRAAVSLTYDDALPVHRDVVAPRLAGLGLLATFYVNAGRTLTDDPLAWKPVADLGHELGNHTLFHPGRREPPEQYDYLPEHYNLVHYKPDRWRDEVRVANCLLRLIDGREQRSFGNTFCHYELGPADAKLPLAPLILEQFVAGRGPFNSKIITPGNLNYGALGHFGADGRPFEELRDLVDQAVARGGWLILMIHGVGPDTHSLFLDPAVHEQLLTHFHTHLPELWVAPVVDVANHLQQASHPHAT